MYIYCSGHIATLVGNMLYLVLHIAFLLYEKCITVYIKFLLSESMWWTSAERFLHCRLSKIYNILCIQREYPLPTGEIYKCKNIS